MNPDESTSVDKAVQADLLVMLVRNSVAGQAISVLVGSVLAWVLLASAPFWPLLAWWLAVVGVAGWRLLQARAWRRAAAGERDAAPWPARFVGGATASGMIWGCAALAFMPGAPDQERMLIPFVLAGMVAGAVPILAPLFPAFRNYALAIVLPVILAALLDAHFRAAVPFALMAAFFLVALMRGARVLHDTMVSSLRLSHEKSRLVADLEQARAAAEEATLLKSQFLATMSHELRTPMNGVLGMTDLLQTTRLDDEQREYADLIKSSAESLLTLISDILDFSRMEAGRLELREETFEVGPTIEAAVAMLAIEARRKGLAFSVHPAPSLPARLYGDAGRLRQILVNLVGNAVKFTSAGGIDVEASASRREPGKVVLRFDIRDTGIGIAPESIDRLFSPFTQLDGSSTRRFGGTGLGLSISRRLAELMGGEIGVESEAGRGSRFWFTVVFGEPADAP
jgi:signal transduction histidine kinase